MFIISLITFISSKNKLKISYLFIIQNNLYLQFQDFLTNLLQTNLLFLLALSVICMMQGVRVSIISKVINSTQKLAFSCSTFLLMKGWDFILSRRHFFKQKYSFQKSRGWGLVHILGNHHHHHERHVNVFVLIWFIFSCLMPKQQQRSLQNQLSFCFSQKEECFFFFRACWKKWQQKGSFLPPVVAKIYLKGPLYCSHFC